MPLPSVEELRRLTASGRHALVEALLESLELDQLEPSLSKDAEELLDECLEEHRRDPKSGMEWEAFMAQLRG